MYTPKTIFLKQSSRSLGRLLRQQESQLQVLQQAKQLRAITQALHEQLPESAHPHCQVCYLNASHLILSIDNSAWATRIRYSIPQLQQTLIAQGLIHTKQVIRIKMIPAQNKNQTSQLPPPLLLSKDNAALLIETAESMSDEMLKKALLKLARHTKIAR